MHLTDREEKHDCCCGRCCKEKKEKGLKLNYPESVALITDEL